MINIVHKHSAVRALRELEAGSNVEFFIAGGYVRDTLRNKPPKDIDIVAMNIDFDNLNKLLQTKGETKFVPFSSTKFGIILFRVNSVQQIEIALPRVERSTGSGHKDFEVNKGPGVTLEQDSSRRDFRINSMYLPVGYKSKKDIIDYNGGMQDIKNRYISFVGDADERIKEDPLRMLRMVSLQTKTGYRIDQTAIKSVINNVNLAWHIPSTRIKDELQIILLSKRPSRYIRLMAKLGLLGIIIPELDICRGVGQEKTYHKYDVFTHCVKTCDFVPPDLALKYAALLHDLGKPKVKNWNEDKKRFTFHNHHKVGISKAITALRRLRLSEKLIKEICFLIDMHMYDYRAKWKNKTVRKFIKKVGITKNDLDKLGQIPLFQLRIADRLGSGFKNTPVTGRQKAFEERIKKAFSEAEIFGKEDMAVNGTDVAKHLRISPGPKIGVILDKLLDIIMEKPLFNNKKDLLDMASELLSKIDNSGVKFSGNWGEWKAEVSKFI